MLRALPGLILAGLLGAACMNDPECSQTLDGVAVEPAISCLEVHLGPDPSPVCAPQTLVPIDVTNHCAESFTSAYLYDPVAEKADAAASEEVTLLPGEHRLLRQGHRAPYPATAPAKIGNTEILLVVLHHS